MMQSGRSRSDWSTAAFVVVAIGLSAATVSGALAPHVEKFAGATPLQWSVRMADSEMTRLGDTLAWKEGGKAKWDYTAGLFTLSLLKLNACEPDPRYVRFTENTIGSFITPDGNIHRYNRRTSS